MTNEEKHCGHLGPGGYKCRCCGPSPKERPKYRRMIRARLKGIFLKRTKQDLEDQGVTS